MEVNRWLAQRLEMCGTMILSLTALFGVLTRSWANPSKLTQRIRLGAILFNFWCSIDWPCALVRVVYYRFINMACALHDCIGEQHELS